MLTWLLSNIFMYAFSVSLIVLSYSFLAVIFLARDSLILASLGECEQGELAPLQGHFECEK